MSARVVVVLTMMALVGCSGEHDPSKLHISQSLAALGRGDLVTAETEAELAALRGDKADRATRDFLFGNIHYQRAKQSELRTMAPDAGPREFEIALTQVSLSIVHWKRALQEKARWPEAERNLQRAYLKALELKMKKAEAEAQNQQQSKNDPSEAPSESPETEPTPDENRQPPPALGLQPLRGELRPEEVTKLLERLAAKESEKRSLRQKQRATGSRRVEKDW